MATTTEKPSIWRTLIGKPIATKDLAHQAVSRFIGLAVFASDALSSTAYATEEILVILAFAGTAYFNLSIPIAIAIAVLLTIVTISYRQTIHAYPNGGGAYIVARDNLGEYPALIAGAALLTDYVLTVAVSISSGVAQIASGIPALREYRVEMALAVIIIMTVVNLRGIKESGRIFALPTYFFLVMALLMLVIGVIQVATGTLPVVTHQNVVEASHGAVEALTLFLVLRAFSSGCTALTGIEAISNGIQAFREPKSKNAAATLVIMSTILITIFLGFTLLANRVNALPPELANHETVISQMGRAVFGDTSIFYYLVLSGTALILLMAANTSYADFPRLAALISADGFLPRQLTIRGSRLVFSWGIVTLGALAGLLVVFLRASTTALIPLYAIGVFLSFTLSQSGMVIRAVRVGKLKPGEEAESHGVKLEHDPKWRTHAMISGVGAVVTGIVMIVFAVTKFSHGAWVIVLLVPLMVLAFARIHNHYASVATLLSASGKKLIEHRVITSAIVLVDDVHAGTLRIVDYAKSLNVPWKAVHVGINPTKIALVQQKWDQRIGEGKFEVIESPFRQLIEPIRDYIDEELKKNPDGYVNVIMGHLVMDTAWEQLLHQNSAMIFTLALQRMERIVVTTVPYQVHHLEHVNGNGNGHSNTSPYHPAQEAQ